MTEPEFDWLTLDQGEEIVWSGNPHPVSLVPALAIGIPLSIVLIGLFIILSAYLYRENTDYVVTTEALYMKTGILSRDVKRVSYDKVQNTSYSQGFLGTRYGYGTIDISTAGGAGIELQFTNVPDPKEVQERINKRVKTERPETEGKAAVLDEVLEELRAIRAAVEGERPDAGEEPGATPNSPASAPEDDG
ncbi:PH domain-containing protein [Natronomonas sp. EA1]|uniref:PH domain-containing protein n=1 Tax=Natronomonas sp. EA1 TaxID=3421655 RepID=UPI003EBA7B1D